MNWVAARAMIVCAARPLLARQEKGIVVGSLKNHRWSVARWLGLGVLGTLLAGSLAGSLAVAQSGMTPEEYMKHVGPSAKLLPPGELKIDGRRAMCGQRPTVIDDQLDDYGAAYPGFLILNSRLMDRIPTTVKLWIHAHECGHQFRGPDEETADCFAVQRGRRQGWLKPEGLDEICNFIRPSKGSSMHFSGSQRCEIMRKCFAEPGVR